MTIYLLNYKVHFLLGITVLNTKIHDKNLEKKKMILNAATTVFLEHGFSAATTDMIQKQASVSKATVYSIYPNKEALFIAVIEQQCSQMQKLIESISTESIDLQTTLIAIGTNYLQFLLSTNGLAIFRTCLAEATRFPHLAHLFYKAGPLKIAELVSEHLKKASKNDNFNFQQFGYLTSAQLFLSLLRGDIHVEYLTHPDAKPTKMQIESSTQNAVKIFLKYTSI